MEPVVPLENIETLKKAAAIVKNIVTSAVIERINRTLVLEEIQTLVMTGSLIPIAEMLEDLAESMEERNATQEKTG